MTDPIYNYGLPSPITASTLVYTGKGCVEGIIVSSHTSGTLKLWDSLTGAGTVLVDTFTYPSGSTTIPLFGAKFLTGLYADMNGTTQKITVVYNPYLG